MEINNDHVIPLMVDDSHVIPMMVEDITKRKPKRASKTKVATGDVKIGSVEDVPPAIGGDITPLQEQQFGGDDVRAALVEDLMTEFESDEDEEFSADKLAAIVRGVDEYLEGIKTHGLVWCGLDGKPEVEDVNRSIRATPQVQQLTIPVSAERLTHMVDLGDLALTKDQTQNIINQFQNAPLSDPDMDGVRTDIYRAAYFAERAEMQAPNAGSPAHNAEEKAKLV